MIENIFPIQIWKSSLDIDKSVVEEILVDIERGRQKNNLLDNPWSCKVETSFFAEIFEKNTNYSNLFPYFIEEYEKFASQLELKNHRSCIKEIWYNYYLNGYNQEIHHHIGKTHTTYTAVYFLEIEKEHPLLTILNPTNINLLYQRDSDITYRLYDHQNIKHSITLNDFSISCQKNDFVIFPSYLSHFVPLQKCNVPRITISMNFGIEE